MKRKLTRKYMNGCSSHQEERMLLELLSATTSPSDEEQGIKAMLQAGAHRIEGREEWLTEDESARFDHLMAHRPIRKITPWIAAAAVLAGACLVPWIRWAREPQDVTVTYIYGNKVEDAPLAMEMMKQTMGEMLDRPEVETELMNLFDE